MPSKSASLILVTISSLLGGLITGMSLELLQLTSPGLAFILLGGFVSLFSVVSLLIKEKLYINEVVLGTAFGIALGPYGAGIFDPRGWGLATLTNTVTLEFMRVVLAFGLFSIGVGLPAKYMWNHLRGLIVMVVPTMAFGWIVVAAVLHALFPALNFISALCIAACLTPTDPVTCAVITGGKFAEQNIDKDIRDIISAESAANDGLAYPFLSIAIYLTIEASASTAIWKWIVDGILYQVVLGTLLGAAVGFVFSKILQLTKEIHIADRQSFLAQYLGLSLFTMGVASTIGVDDLLASFAAGCAIAWDGNFREQTKDITSVNQSNDMTPKGQSPERTEDPSFEFASVIEYVLNCGCFIYIGAWFPFNLYTLPEVGVTPAKLVVLMIVITFMRRIPCLLLLYKVIHEIPDWKQAFFCGHFGPMGVSAIFVSTLAMHQLAAAPSPQTDQAQKLAVALQPIVSFVVLGSIVIHGLTVPCFCFCRWLFGCLTRKCPNSVQRLRSLPDDEGSKTVWRSRIDLEKGRMRPDGSHDPQSDTT